MIRFCANMTGWDEDSQRLYPGGMVDAYIAPITRHLKECVVDRYPDEDTLNAYVSMPGIYGDRFVPGGVLISHGIADKGIRVGEKLVDSFDLVTVPGPTHYERVRATKYSPRRIAVAGYPKLDPVFNNEIQEPERDNRIRVLYAPTHGGGGELHHLNDTRSPHGVAAKSTTWWKRDEILGLLDPNVFDVVVAPHPRHRPDRKATLPEYVGADVVIADGGSTIYEAMILGIPVVFCDWVTRVGNVSRGTMESEIYRRRLGVHCSGPREFPDAVSRAAGEGLSDEAVEFAEGVLPSEFRGRGGEMHAEILEAAECFQRVRRSFMCGVRKSGTSTGT